MCVKRGDNRFFIVTNTKAGMLKQFETNFPMDGRGEVPTHGEVKPLITVKYEKGAAALGEPESTLSEPTKSRPR